MKDKFSYDIYVFDEKDKSVNWIDCIFSETEQDARNQFYLIITKNLINRAIFGEWLFSYTPETDYDFVLVRDNGVDVQNVIEVLESWRCDTLIVALKAFLNNQAQPVSEEKQTLIKKLVKEL